MIFDGIDSDTRDGDTMHGDTPPMAASSGTISRTAPVEDVTHGIEKFTAADLAALRADLMQSGLDSFQCAELLTTFLGGRGYGISTDEARGVASRIDVASCTVASLQAELGRVARAT